MEGFRLCGWGDAQGGNLAGRTKCCDEVGVVAMKRSSIVLGGVMHEGTVSWEEGGVRMIRIYDI